MSGTHPAPTPPAPDQAGLAARPRRETTLHLLFLDGDRVALRTLTTDQATYYGANVAEAAARAGMRARPLRRLTFDFQGEVDGVLRAETVWRLDAVDDQGLSWSLASALTGREQAWADLARQTPRNVPWMHPGWFAPALAWVDSELAAQGWRRRGEPVVLKHWQISALWRVDTTHGNVYFKAVPDFFRREVEVTPLLARELDGAAPRVLAADLERGFLLLDDAGTELDDSPDLSAVMGHLARVQRASVPLVGGWKLRHRGPEYVLDWLDALCSDEVLMVGEEGGLTAGDAQKFRSRRPEFSAALRRLAASPLPRTLGHGDMHGGNVTQRGEQFTILDWSDVCLTHPFFDANPAYFWPDPWEEGAAVDQAAQAALDAARDAYLREWEDLAPLEDLRGLFRDALTVSELFRALGYVDGIQGAVEDKTEWHGAHLLHLRKLLDSLDLPDLLSPDLTPG